MATSNKDAEGWLSDPKEALTFVLVAPSGTGYAPVESSFQPRFTYHIFGDEEGDAIVGYKGLRVNIRFRANDMRPHFSMKYTKKIPDDSELVPTDIPAMLVHGGHLPKVAFSTESDFIDSSKQLANNWTPPGSLHSSSEGVDGTYEIWTGTMDDPAIRQLNTRAQILVTCMVEGASYIGSNHDPENPAFDFSDGDRWTMYFLYRKQAVEGDPDAFKYTFIGFSSVYRFFYFQPPTPPPSPGENWELPKGDLDLSKLPCRSRLSQFVILPPFQGKGMGSRLYNAIFKHYYEHEQTKQLAVEDPNEAFDDLRDYSDLAFLRTLPEFNALKIDTSVAIIRHGTVPKVVVGEDQLQAIQSKSKIVPRQFSRVVEMHLMSQLPATVQTTMDISERPKPSKADEHQYKLWQIFVKKRIYRFNRDALSQIEQPERYDKLEEALLSVELEYARVLATYEKIQQKLREPLTTNGKRKGEATNGEGSSKRARFENA